MSTGVFHDSRWIIKRRLKVNVALWFSTRWPLESHECEFRRWTINSFQPTGLSKVDFCNHCLQRKPAQLFPWNSEASSVNSFSGFFSASLKYFAELESGKWLWSFDEKVISCCRRLYLYILPLIGNVKLINIIANVMHHVVNNYENRDTVTFMLYNATDYYCLLEKFVRTWGMFNLEQSSTINSVKYFLVTKLYANFHVSKLLTTNEILVSHAPDS